ncbi:hypothetical protein KBC01_02375 [Candidatus Parcubacteria bacterium]|nr:hypothetical protein [Candidatus Parcubacteria bacterium]
MSIGSTLKVDAIAVLGNGVYFDGHYYCEYPYTHVYDQQIIAGVNKFLSSRAKYLIFSGSYTKKINDNDGNPLKISEARSMLQRMSEIFFFRARNFGKIFNLGDILDLETREAPEFFSGNKNFSERIILEEDSLDTYENIAFIKKLLPKDAKTLEIIGWGFKESMYDVAAKMNGFEKNINYFFNPIGEISEQDNIQGSLLFAKKFADDFQNGKYNPDDETWLLKKMTRDVWNHRYTQEEKKRVLNEIPSVPEPKKYPVSKFTPAQIIDL